jgi:AraC-like DNA-binding protein
MLCTGCAPQLLVSSLVGTLVFMSGVKGQTGKWSTCSQIDANGGVEMWRGGFRLHISVSAPFVWRPGVLGDLADREPQVLRAQIKRHIEDNLGAAVLGVDSLCRHFNMSRASLYRLLAPQSPAGYIQERRLHRACAMLTSPAFRSWRILDIAIECQFSSNATVDRAFRGQFGVTPGAARELAGRQPYGVLPGHGPSLPEADAEAVRWVMTLTVAMPQFDIEQRRQATRR